MTYDLLVIGGGPGGYHAAIRGAQEGLNTALVEGYRVGGVCLQEGCIPTKALLKSASVFKNALEAENYGIRVSEVSFDWEKIQERKNRVVADLTGGVEQLLKGNGVEVFSGWARFVGEDEVLVGDRVLKARHIIIAGGSKIAIPPIEGIDLDGVISSREALSLEAVPKRLVVIGGGVIGLEFASLYRAFGSEVTVIEMLPLILPGTDSEIAKRMLPILKKQGIDIHQGAMVKGIAKSEDILEVSFEKRGKMETVQADRVLVATGRLPKTEGLDLEKAGIEYDRKGIPVNEYMQTNKPGIYAIGDITGGPLLAHVASTEGLIAVEHIVGKGREMKYQAIPGAIFTTPEIGTVGLTEDLAKEQGIDYEVSKFQFTANSKAVIEGENQGLVKVVVERGTQRILGVHILGPHAAELIHEGVLAVSEGLSVEALSHGIHAHPTLSEALMEAAHGLTGGFIHLLKR